MALQIIQYGDKSLSLKVHAWIKKKINNNNSFIPLNMGMGLRKQMRMMK